MKKEVLLSIRGQQNYNEQEPETVELITEGILEKEENGWKLTYEESDLTGLKGVTTTFQVEPGKVTLSRKGPLSSQMVFQEGTFHESLYQMDFGALMIINAMLSLLMYCALGIGTYFLNIHLLKRKVNLE